EIDRICQRLGLPADPRKFSPHVTLARLRNASPLDVAQYLSARGNFAALPFRVGRFVLMSSRASVGGGPYIVEEAWPLDSEALASSRFASASDASRIMR
ncbi:MAG: RNA 2',3'-cyclic phosphodiesterase, partial [Alphaproteobacteria bacterium]|nr:RNA 2',3'-cyclic phosphodiesterase [Alphaproteobacteria bacterium]